MLQVACSRCECHCRYWLDTLIARHGADAPVRVIGLISLLNARSGTPLR